MFYGDPNSDKIDYMYCVLTELFCRAFGIKQSLHFVRRELQMYDKMGFLSAQELEPWRLFYRLKFIAKRG
jgi:hypothetical protein